jgi:multidrug efflux pump
MCARLLKNTTGHHGSTSETPSHGLFAKFSHTIERALSLSEASYLRGVVVALKRKTLVLFFAFMFSVFSGFCGWNYLKRELSPTMDEGLITGSFLPAPSMNLTYVKKRAKQIDDILKQQPEITNRLITLQNGDYSRTKSMLKHWSERKTPCQDVVNKINDLSEDILGLRNRSKCVNNSLLSSTEAQYPLTFDILTHKSIESLVKVGRMVRGALRKFPGVSEVDPNENVQQDEYLVTMNRDRIAQLGIDPEEISKTLSTLVRGSDIGTFEKDDRVCRVHVRISNNARSSIQGLSSIFVRGKDSYNKVAMVPLSEIISFTMTKGDAIIEHSMKNRSFSIGAKLNPSASLPDTYLAFKTMVEKELLPNDYSMEPTGELKSYFKEQGSIYLVFGLALAFIFLIMAAQFESVRDPLIILISVPLALGGALLSLFFLKNGSLNVYSQIGLITLIGLITKHGILLIDFANQAKAKGVNRSIAILESCKLRLRPILMTTFAMVFGALPLALATGAGSEARNQIGVVIVGGMTIGTLFTLFVVPVLYVTFSRPYKKGTLIS